MTRARTATPPIAMPAMAPPLRDDEEEEGGEMEEAEVCDGVEEAFEGKTDVLELLGRLEEED